MGSRTPNSHHRTRSRMDEVLHAAAAASTAAAQPLPSPSPQRGRKRKNRHSSAATAAAAIKAAASIDSPTTPDDRDDHTPLTLDQMTTEELLHNIISNLVQPSREIVVVTSHSNQRYSSAERAFAKLSGQNWTYYLNDTQIVIGRGDKENSVDVDLGPGKMVSRRHACIAYEEEEWWVTVFGRNGVKLDGMSVQMDERVSLANGTVLEIGGIQMIFVLPAALTRPTLLQIHARQNNLPLPFTPSPAKRTTVQRRSSSSPSSVSYPQGVRIVQGPRILTSPNGTDYANHGEIDLSLDSSKEIKPQYSYAMMIAQAILSVPEQKMQLSKIYEFIQSRYSFYRHTKSGWQNSIRHNLSLNRAFIKVPRMTNEPGKGMKWQIHEDYVEEFIAKVNRTMTPRVKISPEQLPNLPQSHPHQHPPSHPQPSPITADRYIPRNYQEDSPTRQPQIHQAYQALTSPTTPVRGLPSHHLTTPDRPHTSHTGPRTLLPMSSPAPFYRYSSITTPGTTVPHDRSSPPSSGAIDLAETLVEFSSPIKPRDFPRQLEDSPPLVRNGLRASLGDLQGVDLLRGFEKISSWREGGSPAEEFAKPAPPTENGFGRELKGEGNYVHGGVNGNGESVSQNGTVHTEEDEEELVDSQMTEVR